MQSRLQRREEDREVQSYLSRHRHDRSGCASTGLFHTPGAGFWTVKRGGNVGHPDYHLAAYSIESAETLAKSCVIRNIPNMGSERAAFAANMSGREITTATAPAAPKNIRPIGATSRRNAIRRLDGRTAEARYLKQVRNELFAHVGGHPTAPQKLLIERVAVDMLRLQLFDYEMALGTLSEHDARAAHALRNSVRLALRDLGLEPRPVPATPAPSPLHTLILNATAVARRKANADAG